jgi:hypothetical protein
MGQLARLGNAVAAAGIAIVLLVAFGLQFGLKELPCHCAICSASPLRCAASAFCSTCASACSR